MNNILSIDEAIKISKKLKKIGKKIVLGGGCFDVLHPGHIAYLKGAKEKGDILFILLESDATIKKRKGKERPIHTQKERENMLGSIRYIDYIVSLPEFTKDAQYDTLINNISPNIIAVTEHDPHFHHKQWQAEQVCGIIQVVTKYIPNTSTSTVAKKLVKEL